MKRLLGLLLILVALAAAAEERILGFGSDIAIQPDGTLNVTESIAVQVEGNKIQRGIFRDFPTRYENHRGARVIVPFDVVSVERDGQPENYVLESLSNGVRVRIGRAEQLLQPGPHQYRIVYRTARQLGFFDDHDELYWNVTGNGWAFPIEHATAAVRLPQPVPLEKLNGEVFTGPQGAKGRDARVTLSSGQFQFQTTRRLAPNEGLTIVAMFPKGIVTAPSAAERSRSFIQDNIGELTALVFVLGVIGFLFVLWWLIGRDPRAGPLFPRYDAPKGMSPAAVRFVDKMGFDNKCLAAALLGLGARGYLKIAQHGKEFVVEKTGQNVDWLAGDKPMAEALFASRKQTTLTKTYDPKVANAQSALKRALAQQYKGALFKLNSWPIWLAIIGAALGLMIGLSLQAQPVIIGVLAVLAVIALFVFAKLMPRYTREGRGVKDEIEGLRQYLGVAERDDLARMKRPDMTPAEFARMLPYALALGVEKTWADRFATALGTAAVSAAVASYYSGNFGSLSSNSTSGLSSSLGALGSTVSSASTAPGSSSGGGGGGSSGGGGGGGGGGGW